jgi:hypothetical protein
LPIHKKCPTRQNGQRHNTSLPSGSSRATMPNIAKGKK